MHPTPHPRLGTVPYFDGNFAGDKPSRHPGLRHLSEQAADRFIPVNPLDGFAQQRGDRKNLDDGKALFRAEGDGIGANQAGDIGSGQAFDGGSAK
jgi:hypothetical protein